jgi:GNAT superfamily N-acetyltransferase
MKHCYAVEIPAGGKLTFVGIADLIRHPGGLLLTRINIPAQFRRQGHGNLLLKKVLDAADKDGVTLFLHVASYGTMTDEQLEAWYRRNGFIPRNALMWYREPKPIYPPKYVSDSGEMDAFSDALNEFEKGGGPLSPEGRS